MLYDSSMKPNEVGSSLFRTKGELESILSSVRKWRESGINDNNVVPIWVLPLETRLLSALKDIDAMIKLVSSAKPEKKKKK